MTHEPRATSFLRQRLSVTIQRGNIEWEHFGVRTLWPSNFNLLHGLRQLNYDYFSNFVIYSWKLIIMIIIIITVDAKGIHELSCKLAAGRMPRHQALNDLICLAIAGVPSTKEPFGMSRTDGKRPVMA